MGGLFWYSNWLVLLNIFITDYPFLQKKQMCNFADNNTISATATFSYLNLILLE